MKRKFYPFEKYFPISHKILLLLPAHLSLRLTKPIVAPPWRYHYHYFRGTFSPSSAYCFHVVQCSPLLSSSPVYSYSFLIFIMDDQPINIPLPLMLPMPPRDAHEMPPPPLPPLDTSAPLMLPLRFCFSPFYFTHCVYAFCMSYQ